ncbi:MAG: dihydroorotate dehydrogenase electron transfer subunit [Actinobacteria bacterium]|nr:dihydroorotate dehydrogenase electron transfer subunit [Actinomycetota bacterium]
MPINPRAEVTQARILSNRKVGAYHHIAFEAGEIGRYAKPGNFIAIAVGGDFSSMPLHRVFAIYRAKAEGIHASTIEIIVAAHGKGSEWLVKQSEGSQLRITGPLGTSFPLPAEPVNVAIVGGGYGSAPLFDLADHLKTRGCRVDAVIGASTSSKIFAPLDGKRTVNSVTVTTEDGSAGVQGRVTDVLDELIDRQRIDLIYSCGPMAMLKAIDEVAQRHQISHLISVEEAMACGIGICMTCVLPIKDSKGIVKMTRTCIEGPVIDSERVLWSKGIPEGTWGAP